jgi:hypothetical protein
MTKLIVMHGMVISDMEQFLDKYVEGDGIEADTLRNAYRKLEKETTNYVMVDDPDELTDEEHQKLLDCMVAAGGFEKKLKSLGIYTIH